MNLLDPTFFHTNCDYSFGDQSGYQNGIVKITDANIDNLEFLQKVDEIRKTGRNYMTLFIDNIRLYRRENVKYTAYELVNETAKKFKDDTINQFFKNNDLLDLCGQMDDINFIIFTGFEDTPIDDEIFEKIPRNVLNIFASNAISFGGKVNPIPYGIKRKINQFDNNQLILKKTIDINVEPTKEVYLNYSITNPERQTILDYFQNKTFVNIETKKLKYSDYLNEIKKHKFVICPDGNAIGCECHRDWETLYMKRVPIVLDTQYLRTIFKDLPVLFVKSFFDLNENILTTNEHLVEQAKNLDLSNLDIENIFNKCVNKSII